MKVLLSWSSGKDSAWTLHVLRQRGIAPAALLTTINEAVDRVAMHGVRHTLLDAQAREAGLPVIVVPLPDPCSNEVYEQRMGGAIERVRADGFSHVAFGDLFLEDVRQYREERLRGTGLTPLFPLWGRGTADLAREMVAAGIEARLTCIDTRILPVAFAGRCYDAELLRDLPGNVDPCGERGEFHTCVVAGPMFAHRIEVVPGGLVRRDTFVFCDLFERRPWTGSSGREFHGHRPGNEPPFERL
jgi:uncharacterized protein (TIGR00290 family)